ncbi:hypothetical protein EON80_13445, partial [bacterium]
MKPIPAVLSLFLVMAGCQSDPAPISIPITHRLLFKRDYNVCVADLKGKKITEVESEDGKSLFRLTPSGAGVAYVDSQQNVQIKDIDSGRIRTVTDLSGGPSKRIYGFAISPGETAIVTRSTPGFDQPEFLSHFDIRTRQRTNLLKGHFNMSPIWSPSGAKIAYTADLSGKSVYDAHLLAPPGGGPFPTYTFNIFVLNASGGQPSQITDFLDGSCENLCYGRNDNELFFTRGNELFQVDVPTKAVHSLYRFPKERRLLSYGYDRQNIGYDRDSHLFAFSTMLSKIALKQGAVRFETVGAEIMVFDPKSKQAKVIYKSHKASPNFLQFAGKPPRLFFVTHGENFGDYEIRSVSANGRDLHQIIKASNSNVT